MNQLTQTLTSNEVAEMIGKKHSKLMKDIRRYIGYLNEGKIPPLIFSLNLHTRILKKNTPKLPIN